MKHKQNHQKNYIFVGNIYSHFIEIYIKVEVFPMELMKEFPLEIKVYFYP